METDTAGNPIWKPLIRCPKNCGSTGGCDGCMPFLALPKSSPCPQNEYEHELTPEEEKRFYDKLFNRNVTHQ